MFDLVTYTCWFDPVVSGSQQIFQEAAFSKPTNPLDAMTMPLNWFAAAALAPWVGVNKAIVESVKRTAMPELPAKTGGHSSVDEALGTTEFRKAA
jgi:hypothetical protein